MHEGDYYAIMGPSGSGKSTLMNILGYLDTPTKGTYYFEDVDNSRASDTKMARIRNEKIGFVFQSFHLLQRRRAWENVALPLMYGDVPRRERRERAEQALLEVGLKDRMDFYPTQLSGGQCQRVAIARAICTRPKLLLADEPTGALDSKSGQQIMDIFDALHARGMSIIMITHEHAVAERAKRMMHIYDGVLSGGDRV
jgi:putative ABC transport system ATP-binding protein